MNMAAIKEKADALFEEASFLTRIENQDDYSKALDLMDDLFEDYEGNRRLIELLSHSIEAWENRAEEFAAFNARIAKMDGVDVLRLLMEQNGLGVSDLPELGSKSLVSKIVSSRERKLTRDHIASLSQRFSVSPALFF
jgi:HTH-type transcriptional regulator / antitoxin HigA